MSGLSYMIWLLKTMNDVKINVEKPRIDETIQLKIHLEEEIEHVKTSLEQIIQDLRKDIHKEILRDLRKDIHKEIIQDLRKDIDKEIIQDLRKDIHKEIVQDLSKDMDKIKVAFNKTMEQTQHNTEMVQSDYLFEGLRPLSHLPVETLYTSLEQLMSSSGNHKRILSYLKELYCRGLLDETPWWNYDHVTCSACMKRVQHNTISTCVVCSPARNLSLKEYNIHHEIIVQDQLWTIFRSLKPILKSQFETLQKIKTM